MNPSTRSSCGSRSGSSGGSNAYSQRSLGFCSSATTATTTNDDGEMRSHDGIPAQFSPARRAAALGNRLLPSHIGHGRQSGGGGGGGGGQYRSLSPLLSPFPVQESNDDRRRKVATMVRNDNDDDDGSARIMPGNLLERFNSSSPDGEFDGSNEGEFDGSDKEENGSSLRDVEAQYTTTTTTTNDIDPDKTSDCSSDFKSCCGIETNNDDELVPPLLITKEERSGTIPLQARTD